MLSSLLCVNSVGAINAVYNSLRVPLTSHSNTNLTSVGSSIKPRCNYCVKNIHSHSSTTANKQYDYDYAYDYDYLCHIERQKHKINNIEHDVIRLPFYLLLSTVIINVLIVYNVQAWLLLLLAAPTCLWDCCGRHNSLSASSIMDFIFCCSDSSHRFLLPGGTISRVFLSMYSWYRLLTCPNHLNLAFLNLSVILSTLTLYVSP